LRLHIHNNDREHIMAARDDISEHMEVIGADGVHVGTVDHVDGDRIKLTKKDASTYELPFGSFLGATALAVALWSNVILAGK